MNPDTSSTWSHSFHRPRTPHARTHYPRSNAGTLDLFANRLSRGSGQSRWPWHLLCPQQPISRARSQITWFTLPKSDRRRRGRSRAAESDNLLKLRFKVRHGTLIRESSLYFYKRRVRHLLHTPVESSIRILIRVLLVLTRVITVLTWLALLSGI